MHLVDYLFYLNIHLFGYFYLIMKLYYLLSNSLYFLIYINSHNFLTNHFHINLTNHSFLNNNFSNYQFLHLVDNRNLFLYVNLF